MEKIKQFEPIFGEWYVESFIGAGSFGRVYKIFREEFGHKFYSALKYISIPQDNEEITQLRSDGMDNESISTYYTSLAEDIFSEITLMNTLRGNTNIVGFEDSKVLAKPDGMGYDIFIRMELLQSLTKRMVEKPLSKAEAIRLGLDICNALIRCKKNRIIHRDIKPDNIFISEDGDFKLGDFGIARTLEKTTTFMSKKGTYNYMAPEVYRDEKYGASCDIYSLGLVMYRLLNRGRLPFLPAAPKPITAADREESLKRRYMGEALPLPSEATDDLGRIILKACAFNTDDRYSSAEEMRNDLLKYEKGEELHFEAIASVFTGRQEESVSDYDETVAVRSARKRKPAAADNNEGDSETVFVKEPIPEQSANKEDNKKRKKPVGIIAGIAAAAIACLFGVLALSGVFKNKDDKDTLVTAAEPTVTVEPTVSVAPALTAEAASTAEVPTEVPTGTTTPVTSAPIASPTPTPEPTPAPGTTPAPTPAPTPTPTPGPTPAPGTTPTPTPVPTPTPKPTPTPSPTPTPTPMPTPTPTPTPTSDIPPFSVQSINGHGTITNSYYENATLTMVYVWATTSGPCIQGLPDIEQLANNFAGNGFRVLSVLGDSENSGSIQFGISILNSTGFTQPVVHNNGGIPQAFPAAAYPTTYFVNRYGQIVRVVTDAKTYSGWVAILNQLGIH